MDPLPCTIEPQAPHAQRGRSGLLRRFRKSESGVAAIEFGIVAVPFLTVLLAIFETALMLWTSEVLEESLSQTSRRLLTGQALTRYTSASASINAQAFRDDICAAASMPLIDCTKLYVDVKVYTSFANASAGTGSAVSANTLNTSGFTYQRPQPGQIVVARAVLDYPLFLTSWASGALANIGPGHRALIATSAFRAEPFLNPSS